MNLISLLTAAAKLAGTLVKFFSDWKLLSSGRAQGRAESERDHALAAKRAEDEMRALAEKPASRAEVLRRLDGGSA